MDNKIAFSKHLKEFRELHSLTQSEIARILGMSDRMYAYYEKGDYDGSENRVNKYLQKLTETNVKRLRNANTQKEPETYGEFIELYRKLVKQLEERVEVQDKYIALLEANAAKVKAS